jgi:uncharacterized phiE125 gp8 family phage protein
MHYRVTAPSGAEPITLDQAKAHLRVLGTDEDALITALIPTAREFAEHYTGRALAAQTIEAALDGFPCDETPAIELPLCPAASVTSIKYTDAAGVEQTLTTSKYALSPYGLARNVAPTLGNYWPTAAAVADAVRIMAVVGYDEAPKAALQAMLLLIGHLYENRQDAAVLAPQEIPTGARALLDTIKVWGF